VRNLQNNTGDFRFKAEEVFATVTVEGVDYNLMPVPAGTVEIGMEWGISIYTPDLYPLPQTISAFYMGETEITYELWYAVRIWAESNGYTFANNGKEGNAGTIGAYPTSAKQEPVTGVSWRDAVVWCNAYSEAANKTPVYYLAGTVDFDDSTKVLRTSEGSSVTAGAGQAEQAIINPSVTGFRLPTEAQWEYAARGGVPSSDIPWTYTYAGSNTANDVVVHNNTNTALVKSKNANSLGLYDMCGNAEEWGQDRITSVGWLLRGGNWRSTQPDEYCAVSSRNAWSPDDPGQVDENSAIGFRVVCP
jgi:formylglycine-generating enzyme required for sulfatase activity